MGVFNFYEAARRAVQDVVSPEIQLLKGQLPALSAETRRLDEKIDSRHAEVLSQIHRLDEKVDALEEGMSERIDSLEKKIDFAIRFHERLARVEAKLNLSAP